MFLKPFNYVFRRICSPDRCLQSTSQVRYLGASIALRAERREPHDGQRTYYYLVFAPPAATTPLDFLSEANNNSLQDWSGECPLSTDYCTREIQDNLAKLAVFISGFVLPVITFSIRSLPLLEISVYHDRVNEDGSPVVVGRDQLANIATHKNISLSQSARTTIRVI